MALCMRSCACASAVTVRLILRPKKTTFSIFKDGIPYFGKRTLLSDAYKGTSAWRTRKILAVNMDELKITLDADFFDLKKPVSSVDLHKFVDNISNEHDVETAKQYLFCHRHSPVAHHLRASTVHCFIRACIDLGLADTALQLLKDKTNYGLFPDNFTFNLLLNDYLQQGDIKGAAGVAMEMMTLEVLTNEEPLSQLLALHACHEYLKSRENTEDDMHDLGMTFADATRGHASLLSSSYHVLGLVMAGRLKQAAGFLQGAVDGEADRGPCVVQEAVERVQHVLENQTEVDQELKHKIQECLSRLQADNRIASESLDSLFTSETLPQIQNLQQSDAHSENYPKVLETWHQEHVEAVRRQIRAAQEHEMSLKRKKLEKLLEATGGLRYWLEKEERRKQEAALEAQSEVGKTEEQEVDKQTA